MIQKFESIPQFGVFVIQLKLSREAVLISKVSVLGRNKTMNFNDSVLQEAEKEFVKALELNPNSAEIYGNMGKQYHNN